MMPLREPNIISNNMQNNRSTCVNAEPLMNLLKSAPASPAIYRPNWSPDVKGSAIARLTGKDFEYIMRQKRVVIGRHSSTHGDVDINLGHSTLVSRRHIIVVFDNPHFYFKCEGKNGIFVDDEFQRKSDIPMALPPRCCFRFPSTQIKILFESLFDEFNPPASVLSRPPSPAKFSHKKKCYESLEIHIPDHIYRPSPAPSPSGTISAANSCPTSPRTGGLARFHHHIPSDISYPDVSSEELDINSQDMLSLSASSSSASLPGHVHINTMDETGKQLSPYPNQSIKDHQLVNSSSSSILYTYLDSHKQSLANETSNNTVISNDLNNYASYASTNNIVRRNRIDIPNLDLDEGNSGEGKDEKPPYSYAQLIIQAIASASDHQLTLSGIYTFIIRNYPYYRGSDKGWQNSIRHNLSLNRYFQKVPRSQDEPGKGSFWRIEESSEGKLIEQAFKKRRSRGIIGVRSAYALSHSRSAPTSPTTNMLAPDTSSMRGSSPMSDVSAPLPSHSPASNTNLHITNISTLPHPSSRFINLPLSASPGLTTTNTCSQGSGVVTVVRSDSSNCGGGTMHILPRLAPAPLTTPTASTNEVILPVNFQQTNTSPQQSSVTFTAVSSHSTTNNATLLITLTNINSNPLLTSNTTSNSTVIVTPLVQHNVSQSSSNQSHETPVLEGPEVNNEVKVENCLVETSQMQPLTKNSKDEVVMQSETTGD